MSKVTCPSCRYAIDEEDINVAENVAYCRNCASVHKLSELADDADDAPRHRAIAVDPDSPPSGAYFRNDGVRFILGATTRNLGLAGFMLFFSGFWNSIVSVFVLMAVAGWIRLASGSLPGWFPSMGKNAPGGVGMLIGLSLFLVPFVLVGFFTAFLALSSIVGRVQVTIRGSEGRVFTGIGPLGRTKKFDASCVRSVKIENSNSSTNNVPDRQITIDTDNETVEFGPGLSKARRRWIAGMLDELLVASK